MLWLLFGATILMVDLGQFVAREFFLGWSYYLVAWGYLALCVVGGVLLFKPAPSGHWLISGLAVALAIYAVALAWVSEGAPLWVRASLFTLCAFAVWSILLVQRCSTLQRARPDCVDSEEPTSE